LNLTEPMFWAILLLTTVRAAVCLGEDVCIDQDETQLLQMRHFMATSQEAQLAEDVAVNTSSMSNSVKIMELKDKAGGCKGKVGKKGNFWLLDSGATAESCQWACLKNDDCKFAVLKMAGKAKKWNCAAFKKCKKIKSSAKFMTFSKSKGSKGD